MADQQLQNENRTALAGIASTVAFPYLWLSLFVLLGWLYNIGFFGHELGSLIVPALLCLALLTPAIPAALTRFVVRPMFSNLLGHEIVSHSGCITGLVSVVIAGFATLYFLSRGSFQTAGLLLLGAPVVGALLAGGISLLARGGFSLVSKGRSSAPSSPAIQVEKPSSRSLPGARKPPMIPSSDRPALPKSRSRPSSAPASRRSSGRSPTSRPKSRSGRGGSRRPSPPPRRKP